MVIVEGFGRKHDYFTYYQITYYDESGWKMQFEMSHENAQELYETMQEALGYKEEDTP